MVWCVHSGTLSGQHKAELLLQTNTPPLNEAVVILLKRLFHYADLEVKREETAVSARGVKEESLVDLVRNPPKTIDEFLLGTTMIQKHMTCAQDSTTGKLPLLLRTLSNAVGVSTDPIRETILVWCVKNC